MTTQRHLIGCTAKTGNRAVNDDKERIYRHTSNTHSAANPYSTQAVTAIAPNPTTRTMPTDSTAPTASLSIIVNHSISRTRLTTAAPSIPARSAADMRDNLPSCNSL